MAKQIIWAGRTLNGSDRFGKWVATSLDGWWDSPETKGETADRPNADGEHDLPEHNAARFVTIGGNFHAKPGQMFEAGDFITGPMLGRLQVNGFGSTKWADAKRNGSVRFTPITEELAQWQVRLKCPDPRKFGNVNPFPVSQGQSATVYHYGNYDAAPVVSITGDFPGGYTITGPGGKQFVCVAPLTPTQTHLVDFNDGLLRINGYYWTGYMGDVDVWTVPPGQQISMGLSAPSGSGTAVIDVLDTFI